MERKAAAVLTLNAADQVAEILDRIRGCKETRIVVDCTRHALLSGRAVRRELLKRAARELGKEVIFQLGPTAAKREHLSDLRPRGERSVSPSSRPAPRHHHDRTLERLPLTAMDIHRWSPRLSLFLFAFVTGAILTAVVLFVLPHATVIVTVASEPFVADFTVALESSATEPRPSDSTYPARLVRVERVLEGTFPVETVVERGERARGSVELVNQTARPQGIKARTRLQSASGVIVRTERDAILPAQGHAFVSVLAEEGGTRSNLDPQRLLMQALPLEAQRLLYGELKTPLRGGTDRAVRSLAESDLDRAADRLKKQGEEALRAAVLEAIRGGGKGNEAATPFAPPDLQRVLLTNLQPSVTLGTDTEQFRLRATVRGEALVVPEDGLAHFLHVLADARAGEGSTVADAPRTEDLRVVDTRWEQGRAELSLHVESVAIPVLALTELRTRLRGRTPDDADAFLKAIPRVRSSHVALSPFWVRRVPSLVRNIQIRTVAE